MKQRILRFFEIPWYPFALAVYPVLSLLQANLSEMRLSGAVRPVLVALAGTLALFLVFRLVLREWKRAAFACGAFVLLFFTYGHLYNVLNKKDLPNLSLWMPLLWSGLAILALLWAARRKAKFGRAAPIFNLVTLGLVVTVTVQATNASIPRETTALADEYAPVQALHIPDGETPPDIYYIIIDSYGRSDLLQRSFHFDNHPFIASLEELGFYVAPCSQSNYNRTDVSLASSLNLNYLQDLSESYTPGHTSRRRLWASINNNTARRMLEFSGYTSVAFATGFAWSEVDGSDVFLSPNYDTMSEFETLLLRTTPLRHLEDAGLINLTEIDGRRFRERTLYLFDQIDDVVAMPGPKFVFIHIIQPHPPFVFDAEGNWVDPAPFMDENGRYTSESYPRGYRDQASYIAGQVGNAVRAILEGSATPPVIVIQGDHAPWMQTGSGKFKVLNAYYLPGHNDLLYPHISPVNTFRLIFNTYLGADYELLPDNSYYSPIPNIYEFEYTPNTCTP